MLSVIYIQVQCFPFSLDKIQLSFQALSYFPNVTVVNNGLFILSRISDRFGKYTRSAASTLNVSMLKNVEYHSGYSLISAKND